MGGYCKRGGIVLIVIGHVLQPHTYIWNFITLFHVPLFYIISGDLYRESQNNFGNLLKKKIKQFWIPYVSISVAAYLIEACFDARSFSASTAVKIILMLDAPKILGAEWFIAVLFYAEMLLCLMDEHMQEKECNAVVFFGFIIGMFTQLPLGFSRVLTAGGYLYFGRKMKKLERVLAERPDSSLLLSFLMLCVSAFWCYSSYSSNTYTSVILSVICALCGSNVIISCSKIAEHKLSKKCCCKRFLEYLGQNTMGVVFFHFIAFRIVNIFIVAYKGISSLNIFEFPIIYDCGFIWKCIYVIAAFPISIVLYKPIEKMIALVKT